MPRSHLVPFCLLLVPSACFAPHDPIVVTAGDSEANDSSSDTTPSTSIDPTASSTMSTTVSTTEATTTSPSTTDDTADSGSSGSETDPTGSTDDGGPLCGNNMLDGDEVCDDGNEVNGDGCNNDCIESGTLLWELVVPGDANESAHDVEVSEDDVVGFLWRDTVHHIDTFDRDGAALDTVEGPVGVFWISFDFFGNGDFAVSLNEDAPIQVARVSAAGDELWSSSAPGSGSLNGYAAVIATTDDDDVAFGGTANAAIWGGKFDGGGAFQWSDVETVPAPGYAQGTGVACQPDGTCVVAGFTDANGNMNGAKEVFLRLLAPGGAEIWTSTFVPATGYFEGGFVVIGPMGDVGVAGCDNDGCLVLGYSSDGDHEWTYVPENLYPYGLAADVDGNFVLVGNGQRDDFSEGVNALIRKLDADGNELWERSYNSGGAQNDESRSVATDSTGRIFVVGETVQSDGDDSYDAWIRAYAP